MRTPNGTFRYTVERTERYGKDELAAAAEVWEASPGRLVLITCFQRADGRASTENLVVFASPDQVTRARSAGKPSKAPSASTSRNRSIASQTSTNLV